MVGSGAKVAPEQIGPTAANVGVIGALIVTFKVCVVAHGFKLLLGVKT